MSLTEGGTCDYQLAFTYYNTCLYTDFIEKTKVNLNFIVVFSGI